MSKKIPLSQNDIQPTFKGFLERMKNKHQMQSRYERNMYLKHSTNNI